jgi:hypothetical protein
MSAWRTEHFQGLTTVGGSQHAIPIVFEEGEKVAAKALRVIYYQYLHELDLFPGSCS